MKIRVLGSVYDLKVCSNSDDSRMEDADGFCDETVREIMVDSFEKEIDKPGSKANLSSHSRKTMRHEIVHAFLFESGLAENSEWAQNEEIVDWFAIQGPKIYSVWQQAGAL